MSFNECFVMVVMVMVVVVGLEGWFRDESDRFRVIFLLAPGFRCLFHD